ncbi:unnamed protein product, partial [Rotaria magnacalcarata]
MGYCKWVLFIQQKNKCGPLLCLDHYTQVIQLLTYAKINITRYII